MNIRGAFQRPWPSFKVNPQLKFYIEFIGTSIVGYIAAWYWIMFVDCMVPSGPMSYFIVALIFTVITFGILFFFGIGDRTDAEPKT
jgi:hypothetical protein